MPKSLRITLFFWFISLSGFCQPSSLNDLFTLDTILYLDDFQDFDKLQEVCMSNNGDFYYLAYLLLSKKESSLVLYTVQAKTYNITKQLFRLDKIRSNRYKRYSLSAFSVSDNLASFALGKEILTYNLTNGALTGTITTGYDLTFFKETDNNFWFGFCYNAYDPLGKRPKSIVGILDKKTSLKKEKNIPLPGIEFTHFQPNHLIDASNKNMLVAQTLDYALLIFDSSFNVVSKIMREVIGWKKMDSTILTNISTKTPPDRPADLISALVPYHNGGISRLDGAWFLDNTTILTRYLMPVESSDFMKYRYFFDVWTTTADTNNWFLLYKDLTDEDYFEATKTFVSKSDIPLKSWLYPSLIDQNSALILKNTTKVMPYGDSRLNIKERQKQYIKENDPVPAIYLFKRKK